MDNKSTYTIPVIESLRGLAACMVCIFHFTCGNTSFISNENTFKQLASVGWLGVEIFFVISGFVIPYSMYKNGYRLRNFLYFLLRRLLRLEPPYLLSILAVLALNYLSTLSSLYQGTGFVFDSVQLGLHLGYLVALIPGYDWLIPVYWSLAIEFQYYLIIGLLFGLINHRHLLGFWAGSLGLLLLALTMPNDKLFFSYSPYFVLGFSLFRKLECDLPDLHFYGLALLTLSLIYYQTDLANMLAALLPWFLIRSAPEWNPQPLKFLGMISYSLYLLHIPLGGRVINLSARFIEGDWNRVGIVGITFIVVVLIAYGFYWLIEKPAMGWSKRFKYQRQSSAI